MDDSNDEFYSIDNYAQQSNQPLNNTQAQDPPHHEHQGENGESSKIKKKKPKRTSAENEGHENGTNEQVVSEVPTKSSKSKGDKKKKKDKKDKKNKKEKRKKDSEKEKDKHEIIDKSRDDEKKNRNSRSHSRKHSTQTSQVQLLAEHCFTLSEDAIASLVRYRLPTDSHLSWEDKIRKRDELVHHLQEALLVMGTEKQRFQSACIEIEQRLFEENEGYKENITIAHTEIVDPEVIDQLNEELALLQDKEFSKNEEIQKLTSSKNERERRITELQTEMVQTQFEKKDFNQSKMRAEREIKTLNNELMNVKYSLEKKRQEIQNALQRFREMEKRTEEREVNLDKSFQFTQNKILRLEDEKIELIAQIDAQSEDTKFFLNESASLKEMLYRTKEQLKLMSDQEEESHLRAQQVREALIVERELRARAELKQEEEKHERISACAQLLAMEAAFEEHISRISKQQLGNVVVWEEKVEKLKDQNEMSRSENLRVRTTESELTQEIVLLKNQVELERGNTEFIDEIARLQGEIERAKIEKQSENDKIKEENTDYQDRKEFLTRICEELETKIQQGEMERRKLHNTVQELRGNVRVFARVRPFVPGEGNAKEVDADGNLLEVYCSPTSTVEVKPDGVSVLIRKKDSANGQILDEHNFSYDKVFPPTTNQEQVFCEVSEFVQSALDGFNVCLFSYGQTGSGKTHTMQGYGNGDQRGIIPRAMEQVAEYRRKLQKQGWEYQMQVSFLEIYNEKIKDLLASEGENPSNLKQDADLNIRLDKKGKIYVEYLTKIDVDPDNHNLIDSLMATAAKHRSVAKTDMNAQSSRSHSIFTLYLTGCNVKQGFQLEGQLNLCDLAGSERVEKSGATGQRFVETININKSLSSLSDVFLAIGDRRTHVPFRNSKLTHLLMPALSGDGKTLMMINISPAQYNYLESLSTLRFGTNVNQCELGKAMKNVQEMAYDDEDLESVAPTTTTNGREPNDNSLSPPTPNRNSLAESSKGPKAKTRNASIVGRK